MYNRISAYDGFEQTTIGSRRALWLGNSTVDSRTIFSGQQTDKNPIFNAVDQSPSNFLRNQSFVLNGYNLGDLNLDGRTIFAGQNNDVDPLFNVIDSHPLNNAFRLQSFNIMEQLPE